MGRYLDASCRICRREGAKLFLKGTRCFAEKCAFARRPTPPGYKKSTGSSKPSYYALQLREKQKVKRLYGMREEQFKRFFRTAARVKGVTGRLLIQFLERRLDNVLYRSSFGLSRKQSREFVSHGLVFIDGKRVDIPSYWVNAGELIEIKAKDKAKSLMKENVNLASKDRSIPSWLETDPEKLTIKILRLPEKEDLIVTVNEQFIVELYSK